jgi:hypothetical protein
MIRLIKEFHPDMVSDTYIHLAKVNLKNIVVKNEKIKIALKKQKSPKYNSWEVTLEIFFSRQSQNLENNLTFFFLIFFLIFLISHRIP